MPFIKNHEELKTTKPREQVIEIIESGLLAVDPKSFLRKAVKYNANFNSVEVQSKTFDVLSGRLFVIGAGKAAGAMAEGIEEIIGSENISAGVVNVSQDEYESKKIKFNKVGVYLPDKNGIAGVAEMLKLKSKFSIGKKDLVICLLSGGASSMLVSPKKGISLKDKQLTTKLLVESGASILEINTVRKHLSAVKGGQLAEFFYPAKVLSIIISDVVGNDPAVIGSGPTVSDPSTFRDAYVVIEKFGLMDKLPLDVVALMKKGIAGQESETPKNLENASNFVVGSNSVALEAMAHKAINLGLKPIIVSSEMIGKPEEVVEIIGGDVMNGDYEQFNVMLYGGETYPVLPKDFGQGGRNQHLMSLFPDKLAAFSGNWTAASICSDGRDYVDGVSGAIVDQDFIKQALSKKINYQKYIQGYNTSPLFKKMGHNLLKTDLTGTNVGDLVVFLL